MERTRIKTSDESPFVFIWTSQQHVIADLSANPDFQNEGSPDGKEFLFTIPVEDFDPMSLFD